MKSLVVVAVVIVVGVLAVRATRTEGGSELALNAPVHDSPSELEEPISSIDVQRAIVAPSVGTARPSTTHLEVEVVWGADGAAASGVPVFLSRSDRTWASPPSDRVLTDREGIARFPDVQPGAVNVIADRSRGIDVELKAGEQKRVRFELADGVNVRGTVVDIAGRTVPDASVWISNYAFSANRGRDSIRADELGRFELRGVEPGRMLSAKVPGYLPAKAKPVLGEPGDTVDVELRVGARAPRLYGIVRDAEGRPVENAVVYLGYAQTVAPVSGAPEGARPFSWLWTDEEGEFVEDSIGFENTVPVWARAPGFAAWHATIELVEPETKVEIELQRGARVEGIVTKDGEPLEGASVMARQEGIAPSVTTLWQGPSWARPSCQTDERGRYVLEDVKPGEVVLQAGEVRGGVVTRTEELLSEQLLIWNAEIASTRSIVGMVVDSEGNPRAGFRVHGHAESGGVHHIGPVQSDERGSFTLSGCIDSTYQVWADHPESAMHWPPILLRAVEPGGATAVLRVQDADVPSARIRGRILDANGSTTSLDDVSLLRLHGRFEGASAELTSGGSFDAGLLPPGRYEVCAYSASFGFACFGEFDVAANEVLDVGVLNVEEPSRLQITVVDSGGTPIPHARCTAELEDRAMTEMIEIENGVGKSKALQPGIYWIGFDGFEQPMAATRIELDSGEHREIVLELPNTVQRAFRNPVIPIDNALVRFTWRDGDGKLLVVQNSILNNRDGARVRTRHLAPGAYSVEVALGDGRSATTTFEVTDAPHSSDVIELASPCAE